MTRCLTLPLGVKARRAERSAFYRYSPTDGAEPRPALLNAATRQVPRDNEIASCDRVFSGAEGVSPYQYSERQRYHHAMTQGMDRRDLQLYLERIWEEEYERADAN